MCVPSATGAIAFGSRARSRPCGRPRDRRGRGWWSLRATGSARPEEQDDSRRNVRRAATYGFPISSRTGPSLVNRRADLLIVSAVLGAAQAGPYPIALADQLAAGDASPALAAVILPRVAVMPTRRRVPGTYRPCPRHAVILSCGAGLAVVAVTPLIPLVYGPDFRPAMELTLDPRPGVGRLRNRVGAHCRHHRPGQLVVPAGRGAGGRHRRRSSPTWSPPMPLERRGRRSRHRCRTRSSGCSRAGYSMRIRAVPARKLFARAARTGLRTASCWAPPRGCCRGGRSFVAAALERGDRNGPTYRDDVQRASPLAHPWRLARELGAWDAHGGGGRRAPDAPRAALRLCGADSTRSNRTPERPALDRHRRLRALVRASTGSPAGPTAGPR